MILIQLLFKFVGSTIKLNIRKWPLGLQGKTSSLPMTDWYTTSSALRTKGVRWLTTQWKSLLLPRLTAEHSRDNFGGAEKNSGTL